MIPGVYTLTELQQAIAAAPNRWRPLVFTNGCFDLLHVGHIRYLQSAKTLGRSLVVGLNHDASVAAIKPHTPGQPPRPIVPAEQRAELLAALKPVDAVVVFAETTADPLIAALKPDVYVKGGDYQLETLPEASSVRACGGQIEFVPVEVPTSSTAIINRILQSSG
ncbi:MULTISPECIES: adenylyltransferase/cytidyltransferase family protein [Trichocoleus]|uniref:Adenylyltransferase/cytidyltransferase family protein n=1 Tax=Trichocoleus desertorum GB2-A4 TaxID=2933944 RepID=A0ABV0J5F2_9CYAN|nr:MULTISPECIES: adenylyltransferase/cytidyltransferase family protein [unclassified Trichocoleus]MBD1863840.1 adenylyltransferase/cytidyltransferase family protein [Trichocoleus sp. FACHB-46]MBD2095383.1 adenylyltransferase/cytidyltransferase family protein [Trichocoleus sp. FACHB-591]MBD2122660.1 adenylyltransferase/cytidyltransferase family protein [Trichocoleus sp. FACHB-262]